jgi:type IV pilus assembly protein PilN
VKTIHLNLAARPYRDYRPVYAVVVVLSLLTAFLMLNNVETFYRYTRETQTTRAKIASIEAETQAERKKEQEVQERLRGIDVARLDAQTKFVNAKLTERAFSWSTLLDELESVLSDDVRLLSVSPLIKEGEPVQLSLSFESRSADGLETTITRLQRDPQFRNPFPASETRNPGGTYQFAMAVEYLPPQIPPASEGKIVSAEARR